MKKSFGLCSIPVWGIIAIVFHTAIAAQTIEVDVSSVIKTFNHNAAAINLNYLMDDDSYSNPEVGIEASLSNMNIGLVRYPGGEKSDNYLWSVPPYSSADPHFATPGDCNFPNQDPEFSSNFMTPLNTTLDFDEFMEICLSIGAKPLIVVAGDAHYCTFCDNPPSLDDLITNATEWVRYANLTKGYGITHWMIGNESWNAAAYDNPSTAQEYADDFILFSQAMKAVDSSITIVANTQPGSWLNTLLSAADEHVEAIAMSNYPVWNWINGYETYRQGNPDLVQELHAAAAAIGTKDIEIIVSEYNSIDWNGAWPNDNDLGHALVNFQMFGDQVKADKVSGAYLWNTRWIDNNEDTNAQELFDALDAEGHLNATGKALSLWGNHFLQNLVYSTNDGYIHSFASSDTSGKALNIYLINKDYSPHDVEVNIANFPAISLPLTIAQTEFYGATPTDTNPEISHPPTTAVIEDSTVNIALHPLSITVIELREDESTETTYTTGQSEAPLVYPNPVNDVLHMKFKKYPGNQPFQLFNYAGIEVFSGWLSQKDNEIDLSSLASGIYIFSMGNHRLRIAKR